MKHWKINLAVLVTVISIATLTMLISGINIVKDLKVKQAQINVLIDEIGNLKAGNIDQVMQPGKTPMHLIPLSKEITQNDIKGEEVVAPNPTTAIVPASETTTYLLVGQHSKLTDSIIVAVLNNKRKDVTLISIPRDFAINGRKINEFYEYFGIQKLAEEITLVTNIKLDNFVIVDMKAFTQFVDAIGGLDINVDKGIYDYQYPKNKIDYEVFSIGAGMHHMDGSLALKYARSRKSTSDYDRSRRQQQVISAVKERLRSGDFYTILSGLYDSLSKNVETNVSFIDAMALASQTSDYTIKTNHVIEGSGLVYSTYNKQGQWILLPKTGNYEDIQKQVQAWIAE